jgi:sterol desaturase/sphingolipid hydroxylase (fatty acid hydroxylase superfamily)
MVNLSNLQILVTAGVLTILWTLEAVIPFLPNRRQHFSHSARNIVIGAFNTLILAFLFAPILFLLTDWTNKNNFGLLNWLDLPSWFSAILAILMLDAWMYLWHRANHRIPFLWRFHKVHHSDPDMDASTAVRFHTGEILLSAGLRLGVIAGLGLSLWQVLLYDVLMMPIILLHHSNLKFPEKLDKFYRFLFASPAMHRIHHSPERRETDSNYGTIFSFWDRLGKSFRLRESSSEVKYGLDEFSGKETESLAVLALMPFENTPKLVVKKQIQKAITH